VQRAEHLDREMRLPRPAADECILHDASHGTKWSFKGRLLRIPEQMHRQLRAATPGRHANFVINFCQILFEAETARITHHLKEPPHESVR